jgi:cobalt-zinc-cadmium efflux system outer membrane protein
MSVLYRTAGVACVTVAATSFLVSIHAGEQVSEHLTIGQAIESFLERSPALRSRRAEVEQAEGRLLTARVYPYNPEVTLEGARRTNGASTTDHNFALGQEIEIGGQRGRRVAAASADLEASRALLVREEHLLAARVRAAFADALRARALLEVEQANTELARSLSEVARKRLESGAAAQMEVNLAQVQLGRAARDLKLTEAAYGVARALLAEVVGLDPTRPPEPEGELGPLPRQRPSDTELLQHALEHRADLQSFRRASDSARAQIELARRDAIPNLELQAFHGTEAGTDRLTGAGIAIRIPVFNRNQGRIAEARALSRQALAGTDAVEILIRREVASSLARYRGAREASESLRQEVLGTLHENLALLQRSFEVGKTSWTEVLVFRREFVDIQRDYIETLFEATLAEIELDLATGFVPALTDEEPKP